MNASVAQSVTVSVPGKVILAGEYDVLQGGTALAATVSPRMTVTVARTDAHPGATEISSDIWTEPKILRTTDPMCFYGHDDLVVASVAAALKTWRLPDLNVTIAAGFDITSGFGSSSAIRLAVLAAAKVLAHPEQRDESMLDCARLAYSLQKAAQSQASGYDIATQLIGGVVEFNCDLHASSDSWPAQAKAHVNSTLSQLNSFVHVFIGGRGAPTKSLIKSTKSWLDEEGAMIGRFKSPAKWKVLQSASAELVGAFKVLLESPTLAAGQDALYSVIAATAQIRNFFASSPAFPHDVAAILSDIPGLDHSWSWKATGAGGEDAIILIGHRGDIRGPIAALQAQGWNLQDQLFAGDPLKVEKVIPISNQKNTNQLH